MSRITAPLLSFGASGQIGKSQVYSTWKGRPYARRYAIPSNPNTSDQQETRNTFKWLNAIWKYMPAGAVGAWEAYAQNNRFTPINGLIKQNLSNLRSETDLTNFLFSPAANGGIPAASIGVAEASTQLTITLGAPSLPTGWTISKAISALIRQQDPQTGTLYVIQSQEDASAPYSGMVFTGLTNAVEYVVGGWFEYIKPDGSFAYGAALMDTGTPA
jgi:hypothetical protein